MKTKYSAEFRLEVVQYQPMGNIINPAKFPTAPSLEYQGGKK